jgi:hypothetical protein
MQPRALRVAAAISLTLGFSLALALASIADALLFRPLQVPRAQELQRVFTATKDQPLRLMSYPDFEDLRVIGRMIAQSHVLVSVAPVISSPALRLGGGSPDPQATPWSPLPDARSGDRARNRGSALQAIFDPAHSPTPVAQAILSPADFPPQIRLGLAVSRDYFDVLGLAPSFTDDTEPVVILSHAFWRSHFAADPQISGRQLRLGGTIFTIVGVAPRRFGLDRFLHEVFYVPIGVYRHGLLPANGKPLEERGRRFLTVFARNPSSARLDAAAARLADQYPETNRGRRAIALPELEAYAQLHPGTASLARSIALVAALILIIAISNAAGLLLLSAEARAQEMTIRAALGATPLRLLMDRLRETLFLATIAAVVSIPFAWICTRLLLEIAQPPTDIPLAPAAHFDGRVLLLLFVAALSAALVSTFCRIPRSFVAASQISLATALAILGINLATTLHDARGTPLGYRTDHVLTLTFDPAQLRYTEVQTRRFFADLIDRTRTMPGVRSAALAQSIPMSYVSAQSNLSTDSATTPPTAVFSNLVSSGYFDLMHIPILEGRAFNLSDLASSTPVAIVNQELARQAPINSALRINGRRHTVVGVARTARYFHITEAPRAYLYLPYTQNFASRMTLFVETLGAPAEMARSIVDPNLPATDVRSLDASVWHTALMNVRTGLRAVELVGACGLVLALAGLYSVVASAALRRRREIAIRMAIGSTRGQACATIARTAVVVSLFSVKIGFVLSFWIARMLGSFAPAVAVRPAAVAALSVLLLALIAAIFPAWRAARADPAAVLRQS